MTAFILAIALAQPAPYSTIRPPEGSELWIDLDLGDPNKGAAGEWAYSVGPVSGGAFQQALTVGPSGWNDTCLKMVNGAPQLTRHNDPNWWIGAPWIYQNTKVWNPAYVRTWGRAPFGTSNNEVWPLAGLTVVGNKLKIHARIISSPSECLRVEGSDNYLDVLCASGEQSRLMQDRPCVYVKGDRNYVTGSIDSPMCGLFFDGQDDWAVDLTVYACSVGDDVGAVYYRRGSSGTVFRSRIVQKPEKYPASHFRVGVYSDDRSRVNVLDTVTEGFTHGFFSNGGSNQRIVGFKGSVVFSKHQSDPIGFIPPGNTVDGK